jgi:nucleoside-diphosphate-sugar epimerase
MTRETKRVLMTGAAGQIGSELAQALRKKYGPDNVLVTDVVRPPAALAEAGPFELADVTDRAALDALVSRFAADTVYHLAALLSATGSPASSLRARSPSSARRPPAR